MTRFTLVLAVIAAVAAPGPGVDRDDVFVTARRAALDLAGAWSNDGFKLRNSHWTGTLQPGKPQVVQVNLFAGNRYWFTTATTPNAGPILISIYDESGAPVPAESFLDASRSAAGFTPSTSGPYLVKLEQAGLRLSNFCLVYSYK